MVLVARPLTLSSGMTLENRVVKAAMEEQLAGTGQQPDERIERLYRRWGAGGAGLLITGHVMVDRRALAQPGDIVLDRASDLAAFRRWVSAAAPTPLWMQINHPGRVVRGHRPRRTPPRAGRPVERRRRARARHRGDGRGRAGGAPGRAGAGQAPAGLSPRRGTGGRLRLHPRGVDRSGERPRRGVTPGRDPSRSTLSGVSRAGEPPSSRAS